MAGYEELSRGIAAISNGEELEITRVIDGHEISLRGMPHGYYLCGKIPVEWDGSEQDLQHHLRISMSCFNSFDASLAVAPDKTLYVSQYLTKPRSADDLLLDIEAVANLVEIWIEMSKKYSPHEGNTQASKLASL
ncbi:hypothetical protein FKG94_05225 [Exilibacterium tricleocarpae]|uniref:Type III secretion system chaperone n=1 Tax=Exilibacterium tricleocarpae TaxID=2591008 RepID=A0A545U3L9_9GAMM|nr:hypothetical protein [Exilibacterium tricleocarpae]TQV84069.1 hypothetical protein FKG94_05225 [Exilibacterium tricleocarpae]